MQSELVTNEDQPETSDDPRVGNPGAPAAGVDHENTECGALLMHRTAAVP
ncbi:hypothetical protein I551_4436 [Mycobacterium ulcerans str. Harvey]|uniref:Uncharacterized protein n=1 Tax=Mycobacterium ulcerans str. Harvey TaxID=1299332 RepID=A0ABP3AFK7_MYCUL|nr:hypothetical protein I551_4436 [Mycobacterium ulcerans str. Harvey]